MTHDEEQLAAEVARKVAEQVIRDTPADAYLDAARKAVADARRDAGKANDRAVAQGNHRTGYRGAIIRDWDLATERVIVRCKHVHPTTGAARSCVGSAWFHGHDVDNLVLVGE